MTSDQILYQQRVRMLSHADEIGNLAETCPVSMRVTGADGTSIAERTGVPVNGLLEWSDIAIPNPGSSQDGVVDTIVGPLAAMWLVVVAMGRWWTLSAFRADCAGLASFTFGGDPR